MRFQPALNNTSCLTSTTPYLPTVKVLQETKITKQGLLPLCQILAQSSQYQNWKANIYSTLVQSKPALPKAKSPGLITRPLTALLRSNPKTRYI